MLTIQSIRAREVLDSRGQPTVEAEVVVIDPKSAGDTLLGRAIVPSGITASTANTWLVVTPYLRQRGPPAFSAALPPTVETR
jgi:enolase